MAQTLAYPCHYWLTRPFTKTVLAQCQGLHRAELNSQRAQKLVMDQLLPYLQKQGWRLDDVAVMSQEAQGALAWLDWVLNGKNVVSVSPALTRAFERSDCGDLRIADTLPQQDFSLYLHFEGSLDHPIVFNDGKAVFEGAYVIAHAAHSIRIVLCARLDPSTSVYERWRERYDLRITSKYFDISADEAMDYALAEDLQDLEHARQRMLEKGGAALAGNAARLSERQRADHPAYREALRLVLNSLAYLKAYPADEETGWPERAPQRMVQATTEGTPREQARGLSKLWALGFLPVRRIGGKLQFPLHADATSGVRMHWRRGHWRNQPHGPQLSLRKLIWIAPVLVNADDARGEDAN